jgi:glycosyltransferase involved in cell wall biosynthesis
MAGIARHERPDLLLLVTGEGPAREALAAQVEHAGLARNVRFIGYLDRYRELPDAYAAADVFVFPSRTETQGLVLLEAMAAGTPVLALAEMGTRDILAPQLGCVIGRDSEAGFAAQLAALLADRERRESLGRQAREYAASWSAETLAARLRGFYQRVLAGARLRTGTDTRVAVPN